MAKLDSAGCASLAKKGAYIAFLRWKPGAFPQRLRSGPQETRSRFDRGSGKVIGFHSH
jgi:hypothetical protein